MTSRPTSLPSLLAFAVSLLLTLSASLGQAQEGAQVPNQLRPGQWAAAFDASGLFYSSTLDLTVRRHYSERSALQMELSTSLNEGRDDGFEEDTGPFDTDRDTDRSSFSIALRPAYVFYPSPSGQVVTRLTFGPSVGYQHVRTESEVLRPDLQERSVVRQVGEEWNAAVQARLGFEWFFVPQLSLSTDFGLSLGFAYSERETQRREWEGPVLRESRGTEFNRTYSLDTSVFGVDFTYYF